MLVLILIVVERSAYVLLVIKGLHVKPLLYVLIQTHVKMEESVVPTHSSMELCAIVPEPDSMDPRAHTPHAVLILVTTGEHAVQLEAIQKSTRVHVLPIITEPIASI